MFKTLIILTMTLFFFIKTNGQTLSFDDLKGGKWKEQDLPDSIKWYDSSIHICPYNVSFWFKDKKKVDVVWNGFYYKDQGYNISKDSNLIYISLDSIYVNVKPFAYVLKPTSKKTMKFQYHKSTNEKFPWNRNETDYNTSNLHLYDFKPR
jgi:hypothetical protein